jgi:acetolactate synthase-1/2/3 large subunit
MVAESIACRGGKIVFGIPGIHNLELFEVIRRSQLRMVVPSHEQGAGFMANGYSRATGYPGVVISVPGPGLTNSMTSIAEAFVDSVPLVCIIPRVGGRQHKFCLHEIPQREIVRPIVKAVFQVGTAAETYQVMHAAFEQAVSNEPGPVIVEIPYHLLDEFAAKTCYVPPGTENEMEPPITEDRMEKALSALGSCRQLGMIAGMGASHAQSELVELAELMSAPVFTTLSGRGTFPDDHPLSLRFGWELEERTALNSILGACDLILAMGTKFSVTGSHGFQLRFEAPLIHVDQSPAVVNQNYPAAIAVQMDVREFLRKVLTAKDRIGPKQNTTIADAIRRENDNCRKLALSQNQTATRLTIGDNDFSPREFFTALREVLHADDIVVSDTGNCQIWARKYFAVLTPRTFIAASDYQSMGFAIPAAIGARFGRPAGNVVALVGDGGFAMSGFEFMTACREKLKLLAIVFNDGCFGIIRAFQESVYGHSFGVDLSPPDFAMLAQCFHLYYQKPESTLIKTLTAALDHGGPTLLEIAVEHKKPTLALAKSRIKRTLKAVRNGLPNL